MSIDAKIIAVGIEDRDEYKPNRETIEKLRKILDSNEGGGTIDLIWEPELDYVDTYYFVLTNRDEITTKGQSKLTLEQVERPEGLHKFLGKEIWGNDSILLVGDQEIAHRVGYTHIKLLPDWEARLDTIDRETKSHA